MDSLKKKNTSIKCNYFSSLKYAYSILFKNKKNYIFLIPIFILTTIIGTIITTYIPSLVVYFIENNFDISKILILLLLLILLFIVIQIVTSFINEILSLGYTVIRATIPFKMITRSSLNMDYQIFELKETKDKFLKAQDGVGSNYDGIEGLYRDFPNLIIAILGFLIFGFTTIFISYYVLIIILVVFAINLIISRFIAKKDNKYKDEISKISSKISYFSLVSESEKEAKDIRSYSLSSKFKKILDGYQSSIGKIIFKLNFLWFLPEFELSIGAIIRDLVAYGFLIYQVINGDIVVSEFVALISSITAFNSYIDKISTSLDNNIRRGIEISYFKSFFDIKNKFNYISKVSDEDKILSKPFEININNISFKYEGSDNYIFKDFSLKIKEGEKIALVGINGAGKTTLAKLLVGLYYPSEGDILINDVSIKDFNINNYYKHVSMVNQNIYPLAFTIKDNIICNDKFDENKFNQVLIDSGLKEKINSLKNKENTYISQNFSSEGINLSGGEMQKMYLARALYKDSSFLILDEPTSALDPLAEGELYNKYATLVKNKTSIFISHRLSSTRFCDRIYFLKNGKIVEEGSHDELMAKKKEYYKMFNVQAKYYQDKEEENI